MPGTLYRKLAIVLTLLLATTLTVQVVLTMEASQRFVDEANQRLYRPLAREILADEIALESGMTRIPVLQDEFEMLMHLNPAIELYLLGQDGRILAHAAPQGRVQVARIATEPIVELLEGRRPLPIRGDDPREPSRPKIFSVAAIADDEGLHGYLYAILGGEQYRSILGLIERSHIVRLSLQGVGLLFVFALLSGLVLFRSITRRVTELSRRMRRFQGEAGLVAAEASASRGDEIEALSGLFDELERRVRGQMQALREVDDMRRELVASVSHDLRTPLAALQGYLETLVEMQDGMGGAERQRYLEAASRHATRLSRLVGDLLALARFEAARVALAREAFHLDELAQDIVRDVELEAGRRGVRVVVERSREGTRLVADIGLVERAISNLLDNAIQHSPRGSEIVLRIRDEDTHVSLEVADAGPGIPAALREEVFEPFVRGGTGGGEEGLGLGLAIVKRIVELHEGSIEVDAGPGTGARIRMRLPRGPMGEDAQPPARPGSTSRGESPSGR